MSTPTQPVTPTDLQGLRSFTGTLYVRNNTANTITCNTKDIQFLVEASGREGNVQVMPKDCLGVAGWVRLWMRGDITISPDLEEEAMRGAEAMQLAAAKRQADLQGVMEESASSKDMVEKECLISHERVFQTQQDIDDLVPPLADRYKNQAHQFVATQVQQPDGTIGTAFHRIQIET